MDLYTNCGNIRLGNCRRFTSLTMYNLHIFYLAPLMFSSIHDYCLLPCMIIVSCMIIVFFHAWLLFPSMHVASGDRFVSFKAGGDHRDGSFFFYRAFPFLARPLDSVGGGINRMGWQMDEPRQLSHQNGVHTLFFLVVGDIDQFTQELRHTE